MRIVVLVAALAVTALSMSSCERNFTCTCVYPGSTIGTTRTNVKTAHRSDAENYCLSLNKGARTMGGACALE